MTFTQIGSKIYREGGVRGLYRGFNLALLRAVPLHAGTFMTMEYFQQNYIDKKYNDETFKPSMPAKEQIA